MKIAYQNGCILKNNAQLNAILYWMRLIIKIILCELFVCLFLWMCIYKIRKQKTPKSLMAINVANFEKRTLKNIVSILIIDLKNYQKKDNISYD